MVDFTWSSAHIFRMSPIHSEEESLPLIAYGTFEGKLFLSLDLIILFSYSFSHNFSLDHKFFSSRDLS